MASTMRRVITQAEVDVVRKMHAEGEKQEYIARTLNLSQSAVSAIIARRRRANIQFTVVVEQTEGLFKASVVKLKCTAEGPNIGVVLAELGAKIEAVFAGTGKGNI